VDTDEDLRLERAGAERLISSGNMPRQ